MEASDKHHNKSHDTSSSGQLQEPQKPSKGRKDHGKKAGQAESSSNERGAEAMAGDNHAADFGNAGEWPVDPKHDSAGAPVRKAPEPVVNAEEKKEDKKRRKKSKEKETKDQEGKQVKKLLQPSSSSGHSERAAGKGPKIKDRKVESKDNKAPEKAPSTEDCTTKRNLHMIKTERPGGHTEDEEEAVIAKEEKKIKKRKEKKRSKKKRSKNKKSGEKIEGDEAKQTPKFKKKKEVELSSIHVDKEPPARPLVERTPIKTDVGGHPTVEREPLYNIIPNYANIPETTLMRQLKPPVDPNRNPFTPTNFIADERTVTITEPSQGEKKTTTDKEKKEQQQISTAQEWSMVTEKESNATKFKRRLHNPPGCLWLVVGALVILAIILIVLSAELYRYNVALAEEVTELKKKNSGKSPSA